MNLQINFGKFSSSSANTTISLKDIHIRTQLLPGDLSFVIQAHTDLYYREFGYGRSFEYYVIKGMAAFYEVYTPERSCVWVCEHKDEKIGFLCLMDRGEAAQLRYFFLDARYRGIGLGTELMNRFMSFLKEKEYAACYLWTTNEQLAAARLYQRFSFHLTEEKVNDKTFDKVVIEQKYELI